jgi:hypothetical protein
MSQFLETLKARLADAQQRLQTANQKLHIAQQEQQAAMTEFSSWQNAVVVEHRRENPNAAPAQPTHFIVNQGQQLPVRLVSRAMQSQPHNPAIQPVIPVQSVQPSAQTVTVADQLGAGDQVNKTDLIRDVLRQNPNGIKPAEVWKQIKDQVARAYVYSVLSRLKEKKHVSERRGKYYLQVIPKEEAKENTAAVQ